MDYLAGVRKIVMNIEDRCSYAVHLSAIIHEIAQVSASEAASERTFGTAARILTALRGRMSDDTLRATLRTQDFSTEPLATSRNESGFIYDYTAEEFANYEETKPEPFSARISPSQFTEAMLFYSPHFVEATKARRFAKFKVGRFYNVEYKNSKGEPCHSTGRLLETTADGTMSFAFLGLDGESWTVKEELSCLEENIIPLETSMEILLQRNYEEFYEMIMGETFSSQLIA